MRLALFNLIENHDAAFVPLLQFDKRVETLEQVRVVSSQEVLRWGLWRIRLHNAGESAHAIARGKAEHLKCKRNPRARRAEAAALGRPGERSSDSEYSSPLFHDSDCHSAGRSIFVPPPESGRSGSTTWYREWPFPRGLRKAIPGGPGRSHRRRGSKPSYAAVYHSAAIRPRALILRSR